MTGKRYAKARTTDAKGGLTLRFVEAAAQRDYILSEFPIAFELLHDASSTLAQNALKTRNGAVRMALVNQAMNAAAEYGALRCLARLMREDINKLLENFVAEEDEHDPDEDNSDQLLLDWQSIHEIK